MFYSHVGHNVICLFKIVHTFHKKARHPLATLHLECSTKRKFLLSYFQVVVTDAFCPRKPQKEHNKKFHRFI